MSNFRRNQIKCCLSCVNLGKYYLAEQYFCKSDVNVDFIPLDNGAGQQPGIFVCDNHLEVRKEIDNGNVPIPQTPTS